MKRDLFAILHGTPAYVLLFVGLLLTLFAQVIPGCRAASVAAAEAELGRAEQLIEYDLADFEKKLQPGDEGSLKAKETEKKRLEQYYALGELRRDIVDIKATAAGTKAHLYLNWIGRVLLILSLLVLADRSEGGRQKVYLLVLALVLFGTLTGITLDVETKARLGG
ncbi:MAG: hypothetical protein IT373_16815 [Polyangiaceae bacterium]|nr:hypothetical protein [Polyangiaceae bacterium]